MSLFRWDFHKMSLALGGVFVDFPTRWIVKGKQPSSTKLKVALPHKLRTRRDDNRRVIEE